MQPEKKYTSAQQTLRLHRIAKAKTRKQKVFDPLAPILRLGVQVVKDETGNLKVFGFDKLPESEARKLVQYIKKNVQAIGRTIDAIDVFKVNTPGYCPTCPAYVHNWELVYAGKIHKEWCVYSAYFLGKPAKPIMLKRYDSAHPAFHLKHKKKDVSCPLIDVANQN